MSSATHELQVLLTTPDPSNAPTASSQTTYHQALQKLRDSGDPNFLFLRTIIECTSSDTGTSLHTNPQLQELLFHCALGFRHTLLYKWTQFANQFQTTARDFFLALGLNLVKDGSAPSTSGTPLVPKVIATTCLATTAAFWKRSWPSPPSRTGSTAEITCKSTASETELHLIQLMVAHATVALHPIQSTSDLFQMMETIILQPLKVNSHFDMANFASSFLSLLIGEFSGPSSGRGNSGGGSSSGGSGGSASAGGSTAHYNASLDFHRVKHWTFEQEDVSVGGLIPTLQICMNGLGGVISQLKSIAANNSISQQEQWIRLASGIVTLTTDCLSWEFGSSSGGQWGSGGGRSSTWVGVGGDLVRAPESWRDYFLRPDFLGAIFEVYNSIRCYCPPSSVNLPRFNARSMASDVEELKHLLRQLLLLLSSLTGVIYKDEAQKRAYAGFLVEGSLSILSTLTSELQKQEKEHNDEEVEGEVVDMCILIHRLVSNFKVETLYRLPTFTYTLNAIATVGDMLLKQNVTELKSVMGDTEMMEGRDWRDEALNMLVESLVLLADDPWLMFCTDNNGNQNLNVSKVLSDTLSPLYKSYVTCRIEMAKMEEHYITLNAADLDEVREEIAMASADEEMTSASSLGRLDLHSSISFLSGLWEGCAPNVQRLFEGGSTSQEMSPDAAAVLEEARLLITCICYLLTDECEGETPLIPDKIISQCSPDIATTTIIKQMMNSLMQLAELQASRIAMNPHNIFLSPLIANTMLELFCRWAPTYLLPSLSEYDGAAVRAQNGILAAWNSPESSQQAVSFCVTLCLHYLCYWPQENQVAEKAIKLLLSLSKRDKNVRSLFMNAPSMDNFVTLHSITASITHSSNVNTPPPNTTIPIQTIQGYTRLPYKYRAQILTFILIASSEIDSKSEQVLKASLQAVHDLFSSVIQSVVAAVSNNSEENIIVQDMVCLCVELFGAVAQASEMSHPERLALFLSPCLEHLTGLMVYYATDLTVCELLLRFFKDYSEYFIAILENNQCLILFNSSKKLIEAYSQNHCASRFERKVKKTIESEMEEEQSYNDILCLIQLLLNLGAKDFIGYFDSGSSNEVESDTVTDLIFFGIQHIIPLLTQGLLQYPALCKQYFSLVGFMMDTYPSRVSRLPHDLFKSLVESLVFGISHTDFFISKSSLQGIAGLAREQKENQTLNTHLAENPNIFDECSRRLLQDVIFQAIIWDRLEPAAFALLPLAAVDIQKFSNVVHTISQQLGSIEKQQSLQTSFQQLIQSEGMSKVLANGNRMNRICFKREFEEWVRSIHATVLVF